MKLTMTLSKIRLLATLVTVAIVSLSICPKHQMSKPTKAIIPPSVAKRAGWSRLVFCHSSVSTMPASVAMVVESKMGMNTSVGMAAP